MAATESVRSFGQSLDTTTLLLLVPPSVHNNNTELHVTSSLVVVVVQQPETKLIPIIYSGRLRNSSRLATI